MLKKKFLWIFFIFLGADIQTFCMLWSETLLTIDTGLLVFIQISKN